MVLEKTYCQRRVLLNPFYKTMSSDYVVCCLILVTRITPTAPNIPLIDFAKV